MINQSIVLLLESRKYFYFTDPTLCYSLIVKLNDIFSSIMVVSDLKSLSSSPRVSAMMAEAGLAVALVSAPAATALVGEGLAMKRISDGASLFTRYCLLTQRGNYRSQVVNNFLIMLAETLELDLSEYLPAPAETEEV